MGSRLLMLHDWPYSSTTLFSYATIVLLDYLLHSLILIWSFHAEFYAYDLV